MATSSTVTVARSLLFPLFLQRNEPPPVAGTIKEGRKTPRYALGWVRTQNDVFLDHPFDPSGLLWCVVLPRWRKLNGSARFPSLFFSPNVINTDELVYYLMAYNESETSIDLAAKNDEFLDVLRDVAGVQPADEYTLRWYRLPVVSCIHRNPRISLLQD
ncbi:hypothetical protein C8R44DRAFT_892655 [Mycena epipterygia]|nr:hypothetical protein C8R44DRAFT_892655 [Mycena epipterygia]